jgi:hypothetical protein
VVALDAAKLDSVPSVTLIPDEVNPVTALLKVTVTGIEVALVGLVAVEVMVTVGGVS